MANVVVSGKSYTVESVFQWDKNQVLTIEGLSLESAPEIHFANNDMVGAIVRQSRMNNAGVISADIPNSLLQSNAKISAYLYRKNSNTYETEYKIVIPVRGRPKPADYKLDVSDVEVYSFRDMNSQIVEMERIINNLLKTIDGTFSSYDDKIDTLEKHVNEGLEIASVADNAVGTNGLQDASITTDKIADKSISTDKLIDYAVTALKLATGAVTTDKIKDEAITKEKFSGGQINENWLSSPLLKIKYGSYTGTGTYGSDNPNVVTMDFTPYFFYVHDSDDHLSGIKGSSNLSKSTDSSDLVYVTWGTNSVSWYSTNASNQFNNTPQTQYGETVGGIYPWVAIGV